MIKSLQTKGREFESTCVLFFFKLYSIRLISFIIDVPRPLRNKILDHSISRDCCVTHKMSQSVRNIFRDSRENIVPYYSQNIWLKCIHHTSCLNLNSVRKRLKKSMQQVFALRQNICDYFKKYVKSTEIERTVNILSEDPTKITITNASNFEA